MLFAFSLFISNCVLRVLIFFIYFFAGNADGSVSTVIWIISNGEMPSLRLESKNLSVANAP